MNDFYKLSTSFIKDRFYRVRLVFLIFFNLLFCFGMTYLHTSQNIIFNALKSIPEVLQFGKLLKQKNNELSEYERYHSFSISNHLSKSLLTSNFLLTVSSTIEPSTTAFPFMDF